jgi:ATP/ADP translocase
MGGGSSVPLDRLTKLRQAIFPIYGRQEVTKFLLIGSIKFFIILALTLTRDTKGMFEACSGSLIEASTCEAMFLIHSH